MMQRCLLGASVLALAAAPALADGHAEKCFDKGTLTYVDCPTPAAAPAPAPVAPAFIDNTAVVFIGGGLTDDSYNGFVGGVWAPNGFSSDGVFVRGLLTGATWDFASALSADGEADVTSWGGNASIGYRLVFESFAFAPYVGIDLFDRDIDPDASDTGQLDDSVGVIAGARLDSRTESPWLWAIDGNYSTLNSSYYVEGEVGYTFGAFSFGPSVAALGNEDWNGFRAGGFARIALSDSVALKGVAGYQFGDEDDGAVGGNDDETPFGSISLSVAF